MAGSVPPGKVPSSLIEKGGAPCPELTLLAGPCWPLGRLVYLWERGWRWQLDPKGDRALFVAPARRLPGMG